jgi:hypothetical protein
VSLYWFHSAKPWFPRLKLEIEHISTLAIIVQNNPSAYRIIRSTHLLLGPSQPQA